MTFIDVKCSVYQAELSLSSVQFASGSGVLSQDRRATVVIPELLTVIFPVHTPLFLTLRRRIKSHLLFAGIIRSSPFSPR